MRVKLKNFGKAIKQKDVNCAVDLKNYETDYYPTLMFPNSQLTSGYLLSCKGN